MAPKAAPRRKPPTRGARITAADDEAGDAINVPSPEDVAVGLSRDEGAHIELMDVEIPEASATAPPDILRTQSEDPKTRASTILPLPQPRKRLTSVLPRNGSMSPNGSAIPADAPTSLKTLKFKPKAITRRSQAEREEMERAEAERQAARQKPENRLNNLGVAHAQRGRRGGYDGINHYRRGRGEQETRASGVLGGDVIRENVTKTGRLRGALRSQGTARELSVEEVGSEPKIRTSTRVKKEDGAKPGAKKDGDHDVIMASGTRKWKTTVPKAKVKKEEEGPDYVSDEAQWDDDTEPKINIEHINLISDDEDEDEDDLTSQSGVTKGKQRERLPKLPSWQLRPVRLERQEHVERHVGVNTDASSLTSAELRKRAKERHAATGSLFLPEEDAADVINTTKTRARRKPRDVEFLRDERRWKGVYEDEEDRDDIAIKQEPRDDQDALALNEDIEAMDVDSEQATAGANDLSAAERGSSMGTGDRMAPAEDHELVSETFSVQPALRRPKIRGYRDVKSIQLTGDEEKEDEDFAEFIEIWKELQTRNPHFDADIAATHVSNDDDQISSSSYNLKGNPQRENNVYLVQLPPIMPSLRDRSKPATKIKTEEKKKAKTTIPEASANPFSTPIKPDPDTMSSPDDVSKPMEIPNTYTATSLSPPPGCPGTLTIYETGKMLASWGGVSIDVSPSVQAGFAQEVMVHEYSAVNTKVEDESRFEESVSVGEKAWAVGSVEGGFVGGLDWGSFLG